MNAKYTPQQIEEKWDNDGMVTPPIAGVWQTLKLSCVGDQIRASVDGRVLVSLRDPTYQRGLAGVLSRFHPAKFDTLRIEHH